MSSSVMNNPREELNSLLDALLQYGASLLEKYEEFYPFGGALDNNGEVVMLGSHTGDEHTSVSDVLNKLEQGIHDGINSNMYRAIGICLNTKIKLQDKEMDTIQVQLEHKDKDFVDVFLQYTKNDTGKYTYEPLTAMPREPIYFKK